jgi:glycosyltransferase involved in cell wall biosynthesis
MPVTLLISTYNWEEALALSLNSAFTQTMKPDEIVIADDGSGDNTRQLIGRLSGRTDIPILHVRHEDRGFRKTLILNKAIQQASSPYIIQIDGDVILDKHFVEDHLELAEKGCFVCGSRVGLSDQESQRILENETYRPSFFRQGAKYMLNSLRSKTLRRCLANRYARTNLFKARGCNMAFWKADILAINGYNEDLLMWGQEDVELACRLIHYGIQKRQLKMGGVQYHLYHKHASRENLAYHNSVLLQVIRERRIWCENGIKKELL